jgi:two-component system cell cycle response regulator DivK
MSEAPNQKPFTPTDVNTTPEPVPVSPASDPPATSTIPASTTVPEQKPLSAPVTPAAEPMVSAAPVTVSAEATPPAPATPPTDPSEAHVLVVEDNVPNFVLIARMLAFMGVQRCEWKTSGWQVVQFADTLPRVDLILMDIRLPYEDGYQALQKLRANAKLKDTIVCAVTAEASEDQMRRARKAGFNGFLGKPLDPDKFPSQIRRLLAREEVWEWK